MSAHEDFMTRCLELGKTALEEGNPPVGSIIVHQGKIIGEGIESGKTTGDITNHAEILAIRDAITKGHSDLLDKATMYSTHEPCIMCSYVIRHHQLPQLVYGVSVKHVGGNTSQLPVLSTTSIPKWGIGPAIISGVLHEKCKELSHQFQKKVMHGK